MEKQPFILTELTVRKMPGLPRGLKPYRELSPNINIIAGPNASGKSSTARAIQKLIWRSKTDGLQIDANAEIGDELWAIRINSNHIRVQRDGKTDELTGLPAVEEQDRYMLALHELIQVEEGDLAKKILKESIGGFDLDQAAQQLGYSSTIKNKSVSEYKDYENSEADVREQRDKQKGIKKEEERLSDLYEQKQEAEEAAKRKELYDKVVEYLKAKFDFEQKEQRYQEFPGVLEKANGEEGERIEGLEGEISQAGQAVQDAEKRIKEAKNSFKQLDIPEEGIAQKDLLELEERVAKLEDLEEEITRLESKIEKYERSKEEALKGLGKETDTSRWDGLNLQDIDELDQFFQKAHSTASAKVFFEKEIEELKKQQNENIPRKPELQRGIESLGQWLQEPRPASGFSTWVVLTIIAIAVLAGIATFFWWQAGLVGFLLILGLALYGLWERKQQLINQRVKIREDDYRETGLTSPASWDAEAVRQKLGELIDELQEAGWQERIKQELQKRTGQLNDLQKQIKDVEEKGVELKDRLSALPELPFGDPQNYNALYWFIIQAQKWQKAHEEALALGKQAESYKEELETELGRCTDLFNKYDAGTAQDAAEAIALYKHLKQQEEQRKEAKKEIADQSGIIEEKQELIDRKKDDLKGIYNKLEIEFGRKDEVQALLKKLEDFKDVRNKYQVSEELLSEKKVAMESHSRYEEQQAKIKNMNLDQAQDEYQKLEEESDKFESISSEITEIETKVTSIKEDNSLENALKERNEALLELQGLYEQNLSSVTGQLLVDQLKNEVREQNRPKVFYEADKLFNRITKGRYEIRIDEKEEPEFLAFDTIEKEGKSLNQLSTGTRIQLLLSVRMAFVETQESSVKLPILADELLANSDDVRAQAIIEALTEISKDGRQIFYFTAQADEVAKWQSYLSETDGIDHEIFKLSGDRQEGDTRFVTDGFASIELLHRVPETDGLTYEEYGKVLEVESYNLLLDEPEQLHLWYLLNDLKLLHQCLKQGIDRWGKLKSFLNHGGTVEGLDEHKLFQLKEKVQLLERLQHLYRQGRPKPIDRSVLERSGAVSDNFIDEVSKKLEEVDRNPVALVNSLKNSEVSGFRTNKIDELEEYLFSKGFIDERKSLNIDDIQTRMLAFLSQANIIQEEAELFFKRVLSA